MNYASERQQSFAYRYLINYQIKEGFESRKILYDSYLIIIITSLIKKKTMKWLLITCRFWQCKQSDQTESIKGKEKQNVSIGYKNDIIRLIYAE